MSMALILYFGSPTANNTSDEVLVGVRRIAQRLNWIVRDIDTTLSPPQIKSLIAYWRPLGIIFESGEWSPEVSNWILGSAPTVFIDRDPATIPRNSFNVLHDSISAGEVAARELMLTNFRHFAFVPYHEQRFWSEERRIGFTKSLALNGLDCSVFVPPKSTPDSPFYLRKLRHFLAELPKPCAIFAANDRIAKSLLGESDALGLKCPDDIAILGADDCEPICEHTTPRLSSVRPDFQRGGELAALMLSAIILHGKRYRGSHTRRYGTIGITHRSSTQIVTEPIDDETRAALELIQREACNGLTAERVLSCYTCSRGPAVRKFRRATGHSILTEIHAVRLERAKVMLGNHNQQLCSISDFCGFASAHTFRQFFLRKTGMTMSAWRRRQA